MKKKGFKEENCELSFAVRRIGLDRRGQRLCGYRKWHSVEIG